MVPRGAPLPVNPEAEGLKASAVAVALTLFPLFPQMREKKVGRLDRVTCTVTSGLTGRGVVHVGPQIPLQSIASVAGSAAPVTPETEITRAAARAAASAERCASSRAKYKVTTSIDSAAMAIMATMATATSTMVMPRS